MKSWHENIFYQRVANTCFNRNNQAKISAMNVYFIKASAGKKPLFIKVGKSNDPKNRCAHLQMSNPCELELLHVVPCADEQNAFEVESKVLQAVDWKRRRGEWFYFPKNQQMPIQEVVDFAMQLARKPVQENSLPTVSHQQKALESKIMSHFAVPSPPVREILTAAQAAELYGVTRKTLNKWANKGLIAATRTGGRWRYSRSSLLAGLNGGRTL